MGPVLSQEGRGAEWPGKRAALCSGGGTLRGGRDFGGQTSNAVGALKSSPGPRVTSRGVTKLKPSHSFLPGPQCSSAAPLPSCPGRCTVALLLSPLPLTLPAQEGGSQQVPLPLALPESPSCLPPLPRRGSDRAYSRVTLSSCSNVHPQGGRSEILNSWGPGTCMCQKNPSGSDVSGTLRSR